MKGYFIKLAGVYVNLYYIDKVRIKQSENKKFPFVVSLHSIKTNEMLKLNITKRECRRLKLKLGW